MKRMILMCRTASRASLVVGLILITPGVSLAQSSNPDDLTQTSLEDLMKIQVTSVSKKEENLSKAAAAVFVITQEDIRRSGASNIPDLLRMVPGVDVAQIDANTYAISIRGFNDRLADKVLVLIDGRTVYTPTTSGVYWDQQDVPLEDIDRIEVIRGPGGTVWGANAVNGVINIITKKASETQGVLVRAEGGTRGSAQGLAQYGGKIGQEGDYRVFEDYSNTGNQVSSNGKDPAADGWHLFHSGFRSDWKLSPSDTLTVQGDLMNTDEGQTISVVYANQLPLMRTFNDAVTVGEGNILGRWNRTLSNGSDLSLQIYYDRYDRHDEGVDETLGTFDADFQHHLRIGPRNDLVWGGGARFTGDSHVPGYGKTYVPLDQTNHLLNGFFQDEIKIAETLAFVVGSKFEDRTYTGFDLAPSAQLVWTPGDRHTLWISASQAVKEVSREEVGLVIDPYTFPLPGGGFGVAQYSGSPGSRPERLRDLELGYRSQITKRFSVDVSTFLSYYRDLESLDPAQPYFTSSDGLSYLVLPSFFGNSVNALTYGAEFSANWNVAHWWKISSGYSAIHMNLIRKPGSQDTDELNRVASTPENQAQVRSLMNLTHKLEWDTSAYYVGRLRDGGDGPVPAYTRLDTRLGWRAGKSLDLSIVGQNLLEPVHAEFHDAYELNRALVARSISARITWRFF